MIAPSPGISARSPALYSPDAKCVDISTVLRNRWILERIRQKYNANGRLAGAIIKIGCPQVLIHLEASELIGLYNSLRANRGKLRRVHWRFR